MVRGSASVGRTATLNLMLGVFLKLLGFFVILYVYTDIDPEKARLAESSLKDRFNISVSLVDEIKGTRLNTHQSVTQGMGRSFQDIDAAMKTQVDFLSTEYDAQNNVLILRVPAHIALDIGTERAHSFEFPKILAATLLKEVAPNVTYQLEAVVSGQNKDELMRSVSLFIQKMIAYRYPVNDMAIGYQDSDAKPVLELRISEVRS